MLTPRQSFKFGFLLKCAEAGLTPAQIETRLDQLIKTADAKGILGGTADLILNTGGLGLAAGGLAGAAGGYMLGRMTDPVIDPEEIKKRELIAVLNQYASQAKRNTSRVAYREPVPAGGGGMPELFPR